MELTKYEVARIIGARSLQLSAGAPPMLKVDVNTSFKDVSKIELDKNVIPLVVLKEKAQR